MFLIYQIHDGHPAGDGHAETRHAGTRHAETIQETIQEKEVQCKYLIVKFNRKGSFNYITLWGRGGDVWNNWENV